MSSSGVYLTHDANRKQNREDLLDIMTDLSPVETPIFSELEKGTATNVYHEFTYYTITRETGIDATVEGADITFSALSNPTRAVNYVQEVTKPYKVSYLQSKSDTVGGKELARRRVEAMKKWKLQMEYSLIFGSGNSGASNTARVMKGILVSLTKATNASAQSQGSLTETNFNNFIQGVWNNVSDDDFNAYLDMRLKRHISGTFSGNSTKNIATQDKKLINSVDIYESDVAKNIKLIGHRDLAASNRFFIIQPRAFKMALYENPKDIDATTHLGNWYGGKVYGAGTLEFLYPDAGINVTNVA